jgi:hypothetical protein
MHPEIEAKIDTEVAAASKTPREILKSIWESAYVVSGQDAINIRRTMARFATLLVNLSEQADKISRKVECLTRTLVALTVALLVVTVGLLLFEICHP